MKKHIWQKTLRLEESDGSNVETLCEYLDIPIAVKIRDWVLEGVYRELEAMEVCETRDEERKALLRGMRIIQQRRAKGRLVAMERGVSA